MRSKTYLMLVIVLGLTTALVPTIVTADEFKYEGPPAFTVTYPTGSKPDSNLDPGNP
jgi:hypothetical protein